MDQEIFAKIDFSKVTAQNAPNVFAWSTLIAQFDEEVRKSWGAAVKGNAPAKGAAKPEKAAK